MKTRIRKTKQEQLPLQTLLVGDSPAIRVPAIRVHLDADEIIADSFAGGGGASSGMEWALGRSPDIAINHDAEAIAMHRANHPGTKHYLESVWHVDPVEACAGRRVAVGTIGKHWVRGAVTGVHHGERLAGRLVHVALAGGAGVVVNQRDLDFGLVRRLP